MLARDVFHPFGRCVIARQPVDLPVDLKIAICVTEGFAFGDVMERVLKALSPSGGPAAFFRFFAWRILFLDLQHPAAHADGCPYPPGDLLYN